MKRLLRSAPLLGLLAAPACDTLCLPNSPNYYCLYHSNCSTTPGGICLFDGLTGKHCANPATDCPSGYRWIAAGRVGCECVALELLPDLAPGPDAAAAD